MTWRFKLKHLTVDPGLLLWKGAEGVNVCSLGSDYRPLHYYFSIFICKGVKIWTLVCNSYQQNRVDLPPACCCSWMCFSNNQSLPQEVKMSQSWQLKQILLIWCDLAIFLQMRQIMVVSSDNQLTLIFFPSHFLISGCEDDVCFGETQTHRLYIDVTEIHMSYHVTCLWPDCRVRRRWWNHNQDDFQVTTAWDTREGWQ